MYLHLGLCCINTLLRKQKIFCSRTCRRSTYSVDKAKKLAKQNIIDIIKLIEWNYKNNIYCLRISSDIFPHFTDENVEQYGIKEFSNLLLKVGHIARKYNQRIIMHPAQYNQIGSPNSDVFNRTIRDLKMHADILDYMDLDDTSVIIVHGGGVYGNKNETIKRLCEQYLMLPTNVQERLVLENCDRNYSINDCLQINKKIHIPIVFDIHHFNCWNKIYSDNIIELNDKLLSDIINTWKNVDIPVLMHISDQAENKRLGTHADYVEEIPEILLSIPKKYNVNLDLEIEAKAKEQAILKLYDKYKDLNNIYKN